ncbi:Retrotransposon protein [Phytophthora megakarya]|uniref:Retrotransposon protein n=1 Tax=Phytophthora megakarya TaxID=4795 RepID=A0A225V643_9STRA|nr:Retrotransposon protein [Phytophthora megakarya]
MSLECRYLPFRDNSGKIWILAQSVVLQQRLCVVAHAGLSGLRGADTTERMLAETFDWPTLGNDIKKFVRGCLHCMIIRDWVVPRRLGEALHASAPNEVLHFDYLPLPACTTGDQYVLVLKDDMSCYCVLVVCAVSQWVSDRGTHFKNQLLELLRKSYGSAHHFTTAYCPWANGTVEDSSPPIHTILHPQTTEVFDAHILYQKQDEHIAAVQASLENMHRTLTQEAEKRRSQARDRRAAKKRVCKWLTTRLVILYW